MNKEEVIKLMESSKTEQEWNNNCDTVKKAFDGYPSFWFSTIISSGLAARVLAKFGQDDKIHMQLINPPEVYKQITEMPKITEQIQEHRVVDKSLTSATCLGLKQFDNNELSAFNLAIQLYGELSEENIAFKKAIELDLVSEGLDGKGITSELDELKQALAREINARVAAGTFN